jgi:hypothetical protein
VDFTSSLKNAGSMLAMEFNKQLGCRNTIVQQKKTNEYYVERLNT